MKRFFTFVLALACALALAGCGEQAQQGGYAMRYFFSGKVLEADTGSLLIEVTDTGNTGLSEGVKVEVSTEAAFAAGEYARVLMAQNVGDDASGRIEPLSVYQVDETGKPVAD